MNYLTPYEQPVVELKTRLKGHFKMEAVKEDGTRRLLAEFDNMILNNGLDLVGSGGNYLQYCSVGTGNTAPANTQTSLVTFLAYTSNQNVVTNANSGSSPYYGTLTITYRFGIGVAAGNLSEVGVGAANNGTNLFSRALIVDGSNNPTTITVLSTESLDVTYQLQLYVPTTDVTGNVTINGTSYAYTLRAANAASWNGLSQNSDRGGPRVNNLTVYNGAIGAITGAPSGSTAQSGSGSLQAYTSGNYYLDTIYSFGLNDGNVSGGISALTFYAGQAYNSWGEFQCGFTPALPKDNSHTMTLTFRHTWGTYP